MPKYEVLARAVQIETYFVEAEDEEDAESMVRGGEADRDYAEIDQFEIISVTPSFFGITQEERDYEMDGE